MKAWLERTWWHFLIFTLSAFAGTSAFVISVLADGKNSLEQKTPYLLWGGVAAFSVVLTTYLEHRRSEGKKGEATRALSQIQNQMAQLHSVALIPITRELRSLCEAYATNASTTSSASLPPQVTARQDRILDKTLEVAVLLTAPPLPPSGNQRARSCFWKYEEATQEFKFKKMFPTPGRAPREPINPTGASHLESEILKVDSPYWIDGIQETTSYVLPKNSAYEGVIAVPVRAGTQLFGVLTVDSVEYRDFTRHHVDLVNSLGNLLACSLALK
ncbi:GAF domain-containing protein [Spirillospora sp. NBC_00431]